MRFISMIKAAGFALALASSLGAGGALAQSAAISAAVLPSSRTTSVGNPITVFGTIANAGPGTASQCKVGLAPDQNNGGPNPTGLSLAFTAFDATNTNPIAGQNVPVDIAEGANQAYVLAISGNSPFVGDVTFDFSCDGGAVTAPVITGVNTLTLNNAVTALPDVITIGTSPTKDGIIAIPSLGGGEIMAVAAVNIGAGPPPKSTDEISGPQAGANNAPVFVVPDFGDYDLALDTFICETDPATGICLAPYGRVVQTSIGDVPSTFNVFVNSTKGAGIPLYADIARQFLRFYADNTPSADNPVTRLAANFNDPNAGDQYGATSHAITSPGPAVGGFDSSPHGIWEVAYDTEVLDGSVRTTGLITITVEGEWIAYFPNTQSGDVFQFGTLIVDTLSPGDPTHNLEFVNYEDDSQGDQITSNYQGTGTWQPRKFITGSVAIVAPPDKAQGKAAIASGNHASFRALYNELYDRSVTFASLAGAYDVIDTQGGNSAPVDTGDITLLSDGSFNGTVSPEAGENCSVTGSLIAYGNDKNLFGTEMTVTGCKFADTFRGSALQRDAEFTEGTTTPDVFSMLMRADTATAAVKIDLVPQGNIVLTQ